MASRLTLDASGLDDDLHVLRAFEPIRRIRWGQRFATNGAKLIEAVGQHLPCSGIERRVVDLALVWRPRAAGVGLRPRVRVARPGSSNTAVARAMAAGPQGD